MIRKFFLRLYKRLDKKQRLFPNGLKKNLKIGEISLIINELDSGGLYYDSRKSYEELSSKLYDLIYEEYKPKIFLDIGANYGFISLISSLKIPSAKIIAVEAGKSLTPYIIENFRNNNIREGEVLNAICGEKDENTFNFSINPNTSQDNRVIGDNPAWKIEQVPMISIDTILKDCKDNEPVFIKIDTQGYEERVFKGGENFFHRNGNYLIKTEFAPYWLKSQGTNPEDFLSSLVDRFDVAELPATIPFFTESINDLFLNKIKKDNIALFLRHIENLSKNQHGWVDLLLRPLKTNVCLGEFHLIRHSFEIKFTQ